MLLSKKFSKKVSGFFNRRFMLEVAFHVTGLFPHFDRLLKIHLTLKGKFDKPHIQPFFQKQATCSTACRSRRTNSNPIEIITAKPTTNDIQIKTKQSS